MTTLAPVPPDLPTPEQRRIVEWGDGPVVVIARAGAGKTRVIVERVRHLLETREGLLPGQILLLTYNVKAARQLRDRLDATIGPPSAGASRSRTSTASAIGS